jgi:hypothetical protein
MNEEAKLTRVCTKCATPLPEGAHFCPACGTATGDEGENGQSVGEMLVGFASGTAEEIKKTTAPILTSETGKKVAAGAAIGAVAAVAVPFVSIGLGAVIGAGIAALRRRSS